MGVLFWPVRFLADRVDLWLDNYCVEFVGARYGVWPQDGEL